MKTVICYCSRGIVLWRSARCVRRDICIEWKLQVNYGLQAPMMWKRFIIYLHNTQLFFIDHLSHSCLSVDSTLRSLILKRKSIDKWHELFRCDTFLKLYWIARWFIRSCRLRGFAVKKEKKKKKTQLRTYKKIILNEHH